MVYGDAAALIGRTPIVELRRLTRGRRGALFAKVEFLSPGFSKKDRIARQIIDDALASGRLKRGDTVVELTSGNTGTGLAIVCGVRGLHFVAVMSAGNSPERRRMMEALGARVERERHRQPEQQQLHADAGLDRVAEREPAAERRELAGQPDSG